MNQIALENFKIDKTNWKKVRLGDVVFEPKETVKDPVKEGIQHVVGLEHIDSEDIHLRRSASIDETITFTKKFRKGDVLFGRRRAYLKKAARANFEGICSGDITVLRANDSLLPELLPFIINNDKFFDYAITHSAGGLSPRVKFQSLTNYEFLLPSKNEQIKFCELLWSIVELREKELILKDKLITTKLSFIRYKIFEQANLGYFEYKKIGELFDIQTGSKNAQDAVENGIYPFFTRALETQTINSFSYDQEALLLPGEGNYQIKYFKGKFDVHQRTYIFSLKRHVTLNLKLYRDIIQEKVGELLHKSVGSTVNSLRKPIIENVAIPYIAEESQQSLFESIQSIDHSLFNLENKIEITKSLYKKLINKVF